MRFVVLGVVAKARRRPGKELVDVRIGRWQDGTYVETSGTRCSERGRCTGVIPYTANAQRI